ncbi:MAG: MOSC domain-containing protein [Mycobacterium sp.]
MVDTGLVTAIWRYPVKSMAGERIPSARIGPLGLHADRTWAVRDLELGATTSAKRLPGLLLCTARYAGTPGPHAGPGQAPEVVVGLPDGREFSSSDPGVHRALSAFVDRDVELRPLPPVSDKDQYRGRPATKADLRTMFGLGPDDPLPDLSMFPVRKLAEISRYATPIGSYVDAYPIHLLSEQSLDAMSALAPASDFDVRRFRPTILLDCPAGRGQPELAWCGGVLRGEQVALTPLIPTVRCVMPSHAQPDLARDPVVTKTVAAHARRCLGVYGTVLSPGQISEGERLRAEPAERARPPAASAVKRTVMRAVSAMLPRGGS